MPEATKRTKKQHFVPRFYLAGFANESGKLWVHDSLGNTFRQVAPENTGYESNLYTPENGGGGRIDLIEKTLAEIESVAAKIFPKLLSFECLDGVEKMDFSAFLATMFFRSPAQLREFSEFYGKMVDRSCSVIADFELKRKEVSGEMGGIDSACMDIIFDKSSYGINVDRRVGLMGFRNASALMNLMYRMTWSFEVSDNLELITSDNSVFWVSGGGAPVDRFRGFGLSHPQAVIPFPLSPSVILRLDWVPYGGWIKHGLTKQRAKLSNQYQAKHKERFLYCRSRDHGICKLGMKYARPAQRIHIDGEAASVSVVRNLSQDK